MIKYAQILIVSLLALASAAADDRPNILFIFTDDYAYDATGFSGNKTVKTPHLDSLAKSGTEFTHAYNSGSWSGAVCIASRTMLMTGQQVWNAAATWSGTTPEAAMKAKKSGKKIGKSGKGLSNFKKAGKFWPQIMQSAGYDTYYAGKWHTGGKDIAATWGNIKNIRPGMPNQVSSRYKRIIADDGSSNWSPTDTDNKGFWKGGKHWSEVLADDGIEFLDKAKKSKKPFLMTLSFNAPHDPRQAPQKYQDMYPYSSIEVPKNFLPEYPHKMGSNKIRDEKLIQFPRTEMAVKVNISEYYALVTHTDDQIGRILAHLKKLELDKNTIIIFTADHGLAVGSHGLVGKQNMHEHSLRVPWLIAGPGIPQGKKVTTPIYLQDVMATTLDIAKVKKPKHVDFNSVLPLIKKKNEKITMYGAYTNYQRMVIHNGFKLISYPQINVELLYNLKNDPEEITNLSKNPEFSSHLKVLRKKLAEKMVEFKDPMNIKDPVNSYPYKGAPGAH